MLDNPGSSGAPAQTPPSGQAPAAPAGDDPFAGIQTEGRTPAEIEAEYRARLGGHQRGWNAAEQALREQLQTAQAQLAQRSSQPASGQHDDATAQQMAALQRQAQDAEIRAVAAERMAKYPSLAQSISDPKVFAALDDANLAKLSAMIDDNVGATGTFIAPTAPRRTAVPPAAPKTYADKTKDELLDDLRRVAPVAIARERQRTGGF